MRSAKYNAHCAMRSAKYNARCVMRSAKYNAHCAMRSAKYNAHCAMRFSKVQRLLCNAFRLYTLFSFGSRNGEIVLKWKYSQTSIMTRW